MIAQQRLDDRSAVKVAEMLYSLPGCEVQRATFVARAEELSAASLAGVLKVVSRCGQTAPEGFDSLCSSYFTTALKSKDHAAEQI